MVSFAVQAVHCTRWVGVVLCMREAVTIRWLWADLRGPVGILINLRSQCPRGRS